VTIVYKFNLYRQDQIWIAHENATSRVRAAGQPWRYSFTGPCQPRPFGIV
jgi:hypothetical protein